MDECDNVLWLADSDNIWTDHYVKSTECRHRHHHKHNIRNSDTNAVGELKSVLVASLSDEESHTQNNLRNGIENDSQAKPEEDGELCPTLQQPISKKRKERGIPTIPGIPDRWDELQPGQNPSYLSMSLSFAEWQTGECCCS